MVALWYGGYHTGLVDGGKERFLRKSFEIFFEVERKRTEFNGRHKL